MPKLHWSGFLVLLLVTAGLAPAQAVRPAGDRVSPQAPDTKSWPSYRGGPGLPGVAPGTIGDHLVLDWKFETEDAILSSPVVSDGIVYIGSSDQHLYAIDLETGKEKWKFKTEDMIDCPPLVHQDRVYFGSNDFFFYALDKKTGKLKWKFETNDKIVGSANLVKDKKGRTLLIVPGYDCKLYCLDPVSGKKQWDYETANYINATPAVYDDKIVFGGCDAVLHVVSSHTGKAASTLALGDECHVASSVTIDAGKVYMGHYGNEFLCVDLKSSKTLWKYPHPRHPFFSAPALAPDRVVFGGRDKHMHCVSRADGKRLWTFPTRRKIDGAPLICGDKVVFGSGDGRLYVLKLADGKEVARYEVGRPIYSSPAIVDGRILIGCNDGKLYTFKTRKAPKGK